MKVSLNTIKQFTDVNISVDELKTKINSQLGTIEEIEDLGDVYKDAIIVKVVSVEKHLNADKLNICMIDDGGLVHDIDRDASGLVQVVCGAPNVRVGMFAVWLPPRSVVPSTYHEAEPFILGARELRGVVSQGMLAAGDELAINNDHEGILELDPTEWKPSGEVVAPGVGFAGAFGLDDTIITIENKMFTHRPDLFGHIGIAREIAGIQGNAFKSPDWYMAAPTFEEASGLELQVFNETEVNVPRFTTVAVQDVQVKPSPLWLQCALVAMGSRSINNIVDVTNYVMLLTAQPTHAYDYDKLRGHTIGARMARGGESIKLLNGKTYQLNENDIVIADGEGPVGLAGIMGGGDSEVDDSTTNIVLEVANFDMYTLRKSSMRHGVFTDALTRFNKGQSMLQNGCVMKLLMGSIHDVAGGSQASNVHDGDTTYGNHPENEESHYVSTDYIIQRLGLKLTTDEIATLLGNVEIGIQRKLYTDEPGRLEYTPPFWRTDLGWEEDIVEEVGRLYGYDKLPRELPKRSTKPAKRNAMRERKEMVRRTLTNAGANEVLTYSFVHKKLLEKAGQDSTHAFRLTNALSPDLQYYRLSLTPSLLDKVHMNIKAGHSSFALYEQGKTHFKGEMDEAEPSVPSEDTHVALVIAYDNKTAPEGAPYYHVKTYLKLVANDTEFEVLALKDFDVTSDVWGAQLVSAFEPGRSAVLAKDGQIWGVAGEYTNAVRNAFKLPRFTAGFEIHMNTVKDVQIDYKPLSKYPSVTQDVSISVPDDTTYEAVNKVVERVVESADTTMDVKYWPLDIYKSQGTDTKTITFRFQVTSYESTLTDADVRPLVDTIGEVCRADFDGRII